MRIAVYPGSFDPVTYGHIDLIRRGAAVFDKLVIGVLRNYVKKPLFELEERVEMLHQVTRDIPNTEITTFSGLVVDFCHQQKACAVLRGVRSFSDFEYELVMAQTNRKLAEDVETIFLTTSPEYSYVSSSSVRELIAFNGDITAFVPDYIRERIEDKCKK
ncbi:MAG: pantetheine-phosphate adenylyltransferase [Eubacterium sp.]|nr:pantetheine-phosphate adenylyltransferase [Eubacterium sp.]